MNMSLKSIIYLENRTENHNKFYEMVQNTDNTFSARYGKIGTGGLIKTYRMSEWDSVLNKKIRNGYQIINNITSDKVDKISDLVRLSSILNKLKLLKSSLYDLIQIDNSETNNDQYIAVSNLINRVEEDQFISKSDLMYCNRLFKKIIKKLRNVS